MGGEEAARILEGVLTAVPTVVVDLGSHLDERVLAVARGCRRRRDRRDAGLPGAQGGPLVLRVPGEAAPRAAEPTVVVNEVYALQTLTPADIENALGRRVAIRIPYDPLLYLRAANQGTPVFASAPTSQPARRYDQLAGILLGEDAPGAAQEQRRRGLAGIFGGASSGPKLDRARSRQPRRRRRAAGIERLTRGRRLDPAERRGRCPCRAPRSGRRRARR